MAAMPPSSTALSPLALSPTSNPQKRKRDPSPMPQEPLTPPLTTSDLLTTPSSSYTLTRAIHVLSTEATALSHATRLYETDATAQAALLRAVDIIVDANRARGKLVICGVGKSGLVGRKIEATMKSLGIAASWMHGGEAVHGDLGDVRENDALLFLTYSGSTPELLTLLPHLPSTTSTIILTGHLDRARCPLATSLPNSVLLPAPIHEKEEISFGVKAPTTSTTVAMAVGDMLALATAERLLGDREGMRRVFGGNHPGGAIGKEIGRKRRKVERAGKVKVVLLEGIPAVDLDKSMEEVTALDVHVAAASSTAGWVWVEEGRTVLRPRDVRRVRNDEHVAELARRVEDAPVLDVPLHEQLDEGEVEVELDDEVVEELERMRRVGVGGHDSVHRIRCSATGRWALVDLEDLEARR